MRKENELDLPKTEDRWAKAKRLLKEAADASRAEGARKYAPPRPETSESLAELRNTIQRRSA